MRDFRDGVPGQGDVEFRRWIEENQDSYFVNLLASNRGMLHRGRCHHMKFGPHDETNLVRRLKWTSDTRGELEMRARRESVELLRCRDCDL
jgi:hypothetical protein